MRRWDLPVEIDERLWSWARYFRDHHALLNGGKCGSVEGRYRLTSEEAEKEGWGTPTPPTVQPWRSRPLLEAIQTNEAIVQLNSVQKWSVTYYFCYPYLPRFVVLKALRKFAGKRLTWKQYMEQVDIGRMRLYTMLAR